MFRLLGLLGGLSVATDMGVGAPLEESLKRCVVATRLARAVGCPPAEVSTILYTSLLQHLGCTAAAHEVATVFGDDISVARMAFMADMSDPRDTLRVFVPGVAAATGRSRARTFVTTLTAGRRIDAMGPPATCDVARDAAKYLGMPEAVQDSLFHAFARWDGKGFPDVPGERIPLAARVMQVASVAVLFHFHAGPTAVGAELRRRAGGELDPALVAALPAQLMDGMGRIDAFAEVLASEPDPVRLIDDADVAQVARTFSELVDLKSPWLHGHSSGVASLAEQAAAGLGLDQRPLLLAGYLHDLGRVGVSSSIWDKSSPLSATERAQMELHPYHSEQILARVPQLKEVAALAGAHHERCDGSGYHRGSRAAQLTMPARVLAAADRFRTLLEARPHRPARSDEGAARVVLQDVRAGRLDPDAVSAVLRAAGRPTAGRSLGPAGLTERQTQVLRLVAAGKSNGRIARELFISNRTAEHHVQDVYRKIGVRSRAGAALFAMEHGLLGQRLDQFLAVPPPSRDG